MRNNLRVQQNLTEAAASRKISRQSSMDLSSTGSSKSKELFNLMDIPCMNCHELVPFNKIDSHSETCLQVSEKVFRIENNMTVEDLDSNLEKLILAFQGFIKRFAQENVESQPTNIRTKLTQIALCQRAISLVQRILAFNRKSEIGQVRLLRSVIEDINELIKEVEDSPQIVIYVERMKYLSRMKCDILTNIDVQNLNDWRVNLERGTQQKPPTCISNNGPIKPVQNFTNFQSVPLNLKRNDQKATMMFNNPFPVDRLMNSKNIMGPQQRRQPVFYVALKPVESDEFVDLPDDASTSMTSDFDNENKNRFMNQCFQKPLATFGEAVTQADERHSQITANFNPQEQRITTNSAILDSDSKLAQYKNLVGDARQANHHQNNLSFQKGLAKPSKTNSNQFQYDELYTPEYYSYKLKEPKYKGNPSPHHTRSASGHSKGTISTDRKSEPVKVIRNISSPSPKDNNNLLKSPVLAYRSNHKPLSLDSSPNSDQPLTKQNLNSLPSHYTKPTNNDRVIYHTNLILDDINSEVDLGPITSRSHTTETSSQLSSVQNQRTQELHDLDDLSPETHQDLEHYKELQRQFYSRCLSHKIKLDHGHPAQHIPVSYLFQELIETNVKPEDWDAFIKKAFSHPEAFVEVPRLKKRNTREQCRLRPKQKKTYESVEVIIE